MDWRSWCRLCGNHETIMKIEPEIEEIIWKLCSVTTSNTKICNECNGFLQSIYTFVSKTKIVESMFTELVQEDQQQIMMIQQASNSQEEEHLSLIPDDVSTTAHVHALDIDYEKNLNHIRNRYGLKELKDETHDSIIGNIFDETNITGALEIKLESEIGDFEEDEPDEENMLSGEEESEETEEDESDIEELSDSQIKRRLSNDGFDYQEESSDSERKERRRKRKKYKKSEDEILFDFKCHICDAIFDKMCFLSSHTRKVHGCLPQVACYCGKALGTWKRLLIHKQKHFPEKFDYECKECRMVYKLRASFENHMRTKHGPDAKKFVCSQCARCFKDSRTLMAHEKTHLPDELKLTHLCTICQKKFVNKNSLKSHITSVHEMANLYTCETCGKGFSTKSNLKSHLYSHSTEKNVQCDVCSARFKNMDSLRKHKKTHQEKSFECSICKNRYRNRNNLKAHMVCHSEEKQYKCHYCPNEYKRSKDLKCHLNLHTGMRPYQCPWCNRTFVNGSNCRKHKLKDHPEELASFEAVHGKGKSAISALQILSGDGSQ